MHVDDLARLYELAVTHEAPLGRVIGSDGSPTTVRELAEAAADAAGVGVAPERADATRERLGAAFADALLLDQAAIGAKARSIGWVPEHTSVLDEVGPRRPGRLSSGSPRRAMRRPVSPIRRVAAR